ncbi:MAG: hypothetical protein IT385_25260 [Deltaproteobacteria bacterium]|nr:hypothetical protein [Deltaproteobacteria bacterium]
MSSPSLSLLALLAFVAFIACDAEATAPPKIYPADWRTTYLEARGCRPSPDHDLEHVALWIDPASKATWDACVDAFPEGDGDCEAPFADGATFVKPQYLDAACTQLVRLSIAKKDATRFASSGGWHWQEVLVDGAGRERVSLDGAVERCSSCHELCPGHDQRCYMDP